MAIWIAGRRTVILHTVSAAQIALVLLGPAAHSFLEETDMKLIDPILGFHNELKHIRRTIHAHPELSYEEFKTADLVAEKLTSWGIPVIRGMGVTGVVGVIKNGTSHRSVGLRADMDALPLQ